MRIFITTILLLCTIIFTSSAQTSKKEAKEQKKEEQYQQIIKLVQSQNFEFTGRKANPQKGPTIDLSTRQNFVRIKGENATGDMPYFGRAFSAGYSSSDGGIKFDGLMENYDVQKNDKKRRISIKFKIKGADDTYSCTFTISSTESASLSVTSNKRQVINYTGMIKTLAEDQ